MTTSKSSEKKKSIQKTKKLHEDISRLEEELKNTKDKLLRTQADYLNYQKRMEKELCNLKEDTRNKYILELIDLKDLLQKACHDKTPKKGLELILKNIDQLLDRERVKYIDCIGKKFNHSHHHAISTVEKKDCEEGSIVEEVKKGYMIDDKILRPSHVIVNKNCNKNVEDNK